MAATYHPQQLPWCDTYYDVLTDTYHVAVKHNGAVELLEFRNHWSQMAEMMQRIHRAKAGLMLAERVAEAFCPTK